MPNGLSDSFDPIEWEKKRKELEKKAILTRWGFKERKDRDLTGAWDKPMGWSIITGLPPTPSPTSSPTTEKEKRSTTDAEAYTRALAEAERGVVKQATVPTETEPARPMGGAFELPTEPAYPEKPTPYRISPEIDTVLKKAIDLMEGGISGAGSLFQHRRRESRAQRKMASDLMGLVGSMMGAEAGTYPELGRFRAELEARGARPAVIEALTKAKEIEMGMGLLPEKQKGMEAERIAKEAETEKIRREITGLPLTFKERKEAEEAVARAGRAERAEKDPLEKYRLEYQKQLNEAEKTPLATPGEITTKKRAITERWRYILPELTETTTRVPTLDEYWTEAKKGRPAVSKDTVKKWLIENKYEFTE